MIRPLKRRNVLRHRHLARRMGAVPWQQMQKVPLAKKEFSRSLPPKYTGLRLCRWPLQAGFQKLSRPG